jgi:hypothetical protein
VQQGIPTARISFNVLAAAIPFTVPKPAKKRDGDLTSSSAKPISHTPVGSVKTPAKQATPSIAAVHVEVIKALDI